MKTLLIGTIRAYQGVHGIFFSNCCRFHPSCSNYATEAIRTRGVGAGLLLTGYRILRCHPFYRGDWNDPVPVRGFAPAARDIFSGENIEKA